MIGENKNVKYMKLQELRMILKTQQYPKMVVEIGIKKSLATPQEQLPSEKLKNSDDFTEVLISTYNPNNPNVLPKVSKPPNLKIFAKRQPSNLKRLLCSSNFSTNKQQSARKVAFVAIILPRVNSLNLRIGTKHFQNLI